jgi:hypothetical protein
LNFKRDKRKKEEEEVFMTLNSSGISKIVYTSIHLSKHMLDLLMRDPLKKTHVINCAGKQLHEAKEFQMD